MVNVKDAILVTKNTKQLDFTKATATLHCDNTAAQDNVMQTLEYSHRVLTALVIQHLNVCRLRSVLFSRAPPKWLHKVCKLIGIASYPPARMQLNCVSSILNVAKNTGLRCRVQRVLQQACYLPFSRDNALAQAVER